MTVPTIILRASDCCWSVWSYAKLTTFNDACDRFGHSSPASDSRWNTHSARSWQAIPSHCNLESQRQQPATNCSNSALQSESLWSFPACYVPCLLSLHERIFASVGPHSFGPMVGSMQTLWNCWMLTRQVACFSRTPHKEWNWSGPWWLYCHELNININWMTWSRLKLGNRLHLIHIL